jgi:hypothetical protein
VTWLPVTINPSGTSNGAPVLGYNIYADGKEVQNVEVGTADQAVVEMASTASTITMRTKSSNDILSVESELVKMPLAIKSGLMKSSDDSDDEEEETPKKQPREMIINYSGYPELDSDIGPSELSDIGMYQ